MNREQEQKMREGVIEQFFVLLKAIHGGDEEAVGKMLELWDEDGTIELTGIFPYSGKFTGLNAIAVLYKNVCRSVGMPLRLEKSGPTNLGPRKFDVESIRSVGGKVVAKWTTTITTTDGHGYLVGGGDTFTFRGNKIFTDLCILSPKAEAIKGFKVNDLSLNDIGRLALAAWPVV